MNLAVWRELLRRGSDGTGPPEIDLARVEAEAARRIRLHVALATVVSVLVAGALVITGLAARAVAHGGAEDVPVEDLVSVPLLTALDRGAAEEVLQRVGLGLGQVVFRDSDEPKGTVIEQNPAAGDSVGKGAAVDVILARASLELVEVPLITGMSREDAEAELAAVGLRTGSISFADSEDPAGTVIDQRPAAGATVELASSVDLVESQPAFELVEVPLIEGLSLEEASAELEAAGLRLGKVSPNDSEERPGTVLEQDPVAGTRVGEGTEINVVASQPPNVVIEVPALTGATREAAEGMLSSVGLTVGTISFRDGGGKDGTVLEQDPAAGTEVIEGTPVNLVLDRDSPVD